jgi:hypothetical protein
MPLLFRKGAPAVPVYVFQLLETLPGLQDLVFADLGTCVRLQELHLFARIAQQTALQHLSFSIERESVANGPPVAGPRGLQFIAVKWMVRDAVGEPGSSMGHLYKFLQPSLDTLTHLELQDYPHLDFQVFGPACTSLRTFKYTTYSQSPKMLEAVAEMFPNITDLEMVFLGYLWTVCRILIRQAK